MPFRFGPVGLSPTLAITNFGVDDNIFNDATEPKRDFTMTVTPRLQARLRSGKVLLSGAVATGLVYYQKYDDERSIDYAADGRVDFDLGWFQPYALASLLDTRERLNAELDVRAPRTQTTLAAGAKALLSPKTGLVFDLRRAGLDFAEGTTFDGVSAEPVAQLDDPDHRGRPGVVSDAPDDVRRHHVVSDRSLRPVAREGCRHVPDSALDSHGVAGDHPGLTRRRLSSLLGD